MGLWDRDKLLFLKNTHFFMGQSFPTDGWFLWLISNPSFGNVRHPTGCVHSESFIPTKLVETLLFVTPKPKKLNFYYHRFTDEKKRLNNSAQLNTANKGHSLCAWVNRL